MDKRFIEESFPVKEVSKDSAKEKTLRHGHISTLHLWWARRPLSSSRTTNFAALIQEPIDEIDWVKKRNFIIELSKWENSSNHNVLNKARKEIIDIYGRPPKVLDPFSGGGAIPLESLRLGCETYANDYNPVAVFIEKCTLEYPQKYRNKKNANWSDGNINLINDVKKYGQWVLEEVKNEIGEFYPNENQHVPVGYLWTRTVPCQNPSCNAEIPLMRQFWLSKKKNKKIALYPYIENEIIKFKIVGEGYEKIPENFDPNNGTISRAVIVCPICQSTIDASDTRNIFKNKKSGQRMVVKVLKGKNGKIYKLASDKDLKIFEGSEKYLNKKINQLKDEWEIQPVPNESLPPVGTLGFRVQRYNMLKWGDLFNSRQKLALITFVEKIRELNQKLVDDGFDEYNSKCIVSYLGCALSRLVDQSTVLVPWIVQLEAVAHTFNRQTLSMVWDYVEAYPFAYFSNSLDWIRRVLEHLYEIKPSADITITNSSATQLPYIDEFFDAVFTDPPYYDNVPYSYLSDMFYVWLKRAVGNLYPELFSTPLTPKSNEIVAYSHDKSWDEAKNLFESMLSESFKEIYRVLKFGGISTIVYAHKTTEGWETVINALLDSGLTVTASWPISTEMKARLRAKNSAALASSIYIVARKIEKPSIGWYKDLKIEIENYIPQKLDKLWEEGISGADFFISAIGSAIEIFGKYDKVLDNEGNEIRADKLLAFVRNVVTDYTVRHILHNGIADELSPLTKFYLLWRWNYQDVRVPFDDARKLAQSAGIDLANEWNKGFIVKRGEFIRVQGPDKRDEKYLEDSKELIDVLHHICLLWKEGKQNEMKLALKKSGYGEGDALYKVAQAISETLPNNSSEKKMIEGFLAGRDKIMQDMREDDSQTKLI